MIDEFHFDFSGMTVAEFQFLAGVSYPLERGQMIQYFELIRRYTIGIDLADVGREEFLRIGKLFILALADHISTAIEVEEYLQSLEKEFE